MDSLHISGKLYISSHRAAKEYGYHPDYIGQLVRSRKLKGQKVGRSWYVLTESLVTYFGIVKGPEVSAEEVEIALEETSQASENSITDSVEDAESSSASDEEAARHLNVVEVEEEKNNVEVSVEESTENNFQTAEPVIPPILLYGTSHTTSRYAPPRSIPIKEHKLLTYILDEAKSSPVVPPAGIPARPAKPQNIVKPQTSVPAIKITKPVNREQETIPETKHRKRNVLGPVVALSILGTVTFVITIGISVLYTFNLLYIG